MDQIRNFSPRTQHIHIFHGNKQLSRKHYEQSGAIANGSSKRNVWLSKQSYDWGVSKLEDHECPLLPLCPAPWLARAALSAVGL